MEHILEQFGFNWGLFIAQIINFLILAFLFKKFLYSSLLEMIDKRRKTIEQGLKDSEKAALALESAQSEKDVILKQAAQESQAIIEETKKTADSLKEEILLTARTEAEKIITDAKKQSEIEMEKMKKEAATMSLALSKAVLDKVVTDLFSKSEKETVIKKGLERIQKNG